MDFNLQNSVHTLVVGKLLAGAAGRRRYHIASTEKGRLTRLLNAESGVLAKRYRTLFTFVLKAKPPYLFAGRQDLYGESVAIQHGVSFFSGFETVDVRFSQCHTAFLPSLHRKSRHGIRNALLCRLCVESTFLL